MKFRNLIAVVGVAFVLGGCSVDPPKQHQFANTRSYPNVSFDKGWENVVGFFANNSIPIKNIAKDSGVIYAETSMFPPEMADCGGNWANWENWDAEDKVGVTAIGKFNVFFRRGNPMTVTVNANFAMESHELGAIPCYSTGVLEGRILDAVEGHSNPQNVGGRN